MPQSLSPMPDHLDRLLAACDPVARGAVETDEIEAALDGIGIAIAGQEHRRVRRRRRLWLARPRRALVVALSLASLGGGVAAGTTLFINAHTHTYAPKWAIQGAGPGEILDTRGTNFRQVALALAAGIPYPSGYASSWHDQVLRLNAPPYTWRLPSGQLRGDFATSAIVAWVIDWRRAMRSGDRARASHDAATLAGALHWSAVTAWDPHPSLSIRGDMGTTHPSTFGWAIPYIAAIRAGDLATVDHLLVGDYRSGRKDYVLYGEFGMFTPGYGAASPPGKNNWLQATGSPDTPQSYLRYLAIRGLS